MQQAEITTHQQGSGWTATSEQYNLTAFGQTDEQALAKLKKMIDTMKALNQRRQSEEHRD